MQSPSKVSGIFQQLLCCPICRANLELRNQHYQCQNFGCNFLFPLINDIPILIDENSSIFSIEDFLTHRNTYFDLSQSSKLKEILKRLIPQLGRNIKAVSNYQRFTKLLLNQSSHPKVLVLGGSILGQGMQVMVDNPEIILLETDVSFGPRTAIILDAHSIPFKDGSFDGVIVQAVLEHVVEPQKCVEEIHRVLKKDGLVYAETPFMQQVHGRCYDFTRFTHLGHRRLFRQFEEIDSGPSCGSGMALAWSYNYFLLSFTSARFLRILINIFTKITAFYLKYFDHLVIDNPGCFDAASAYYFIGRKSESILSDKELIKLYKGAF